MNPHTDPADAKAAMMERSDDPCPLCKTHDDEVVLTGQDRLHGLPGRFQVVRCRHCRLMRTNPRPTPLAMAYYYPAGYGPYLATRALPVAAGEGLLRRLSKRFIDFRTHSIPPLKPGRLLEIGCASGAYLQLMQQRGWEAEGIEVSPDAAAWAQAQGLKVRQSTLETAEGPGQTFDLITAWMAIEHLHDPVRALERLRTWTRPGGWLAFSIPNAASLEFRVFGEHWCALHLPCHLFHFTPATMGRLLARTGWKMERILHQRLIHNVPLSLGLRLKARQPSSRLAQTLLSVDQKGLAFSLAQYPAAIVAAALGQTGRMTLWARRS